MTWFPRIACGATAHRFRYGLKEPAEAGSNGKKAVVCLELPEFVYSTWEPTVPTDEDTDEESARAE